MDDYVGSVCALESAEVNCMWVCESQAQSQWCSFRNYGTIDTVVKFVWT